MDIKTNNGSLPVPGRDYCVRLVDLDARVNGVTAVDEEGFANVYINSRQSFDRQCKAFFHELSHIARDDFSQNA